jgi:hypothetical protein
VLTLTKGEYDESFDEDSIQRIGSAMVNIHTMEVVKVQLTKEELRQWNNAQASKFLSVDPLQSKYPMLTPYQFASNSPIANVDLDGREKLVAIINNDSKGKASLQIITNREAIISIWKSFSGANAIGDKKIVWEEGVGAYGQTSVGGESRFKTYSEGYRNGDISNGQQFYPDAIDGAGILTIDIRGKNAVMKYYDWELDYGRKVQGAEDKTNAEISRQIDLTINLTTLAIGVGELRTAKSLFEGGIALANISSTADNIIGASKNMKEGTLKTVVENLKTSIAIYNTLESVKTIKASDAPNAKKAKSLFGLTQDVPEAKEKIKLDIEKLKKLIEEKKSNKKE